MKIELETSPSLSLERKIRMHEAREAIIDRLARDLPTNIDLERFLDGRRIRDRPNAAGRPVRRASAYRGPRAADQPRMATR